MIDDSDRLKPCPFCGGAAEMGCVRSESGEEPNEGGYFIACLACDASTGLRFACGDDPKPLLIEQWNRRTALAQQAEPVQGPAFHGFMSDDGTQVDVCFSPSAPRKDGTYATAYYTAPPQRQPLTEEEIESCRQKGYAHAGLGAPFDFGKAARAVERAVWEKNHG